MVCLSIDSCCFAEEDGEEAQSMFRTANCIPRWAVSTIAVALITLAGTIGSLAHESTPAPIACQPAVPNNVEPPSHLLHFANPENTFFMNGIWAGLYPDGIMLIDKNAIVADGEYAGWRAQKMWWTRDDGVVGPLIVTGTLLDGEAPDAVNISFARQYGSMGFTPVGLAFAEEGCWQITGSVGNHTTTFTMQVDFVDVYPWMTTPET